MDNPKEREIREEPFEVSADGVSIRGVLVEPAGEEKLPALIILHGIPREKHAPGDQSYRHMARRFAKQGFSAVVVNFRGTGESDGNIDMDGWAKDLDAVLAFVRSRPETDENRVALLGFSAGAAIAICAAARDPGVSMVVSVSSPAEFSFLRGEMDSKGWIELFKKIGLIRDPDFPASVEEWEKGFERAAPIDWVDRISPRPLFIIHGESDEVVPIDHAERLFDKAGEPKDMLVIEDGPHRLRVDDRAVDASMKRLLEWKTNK